LPGNKENGIALFDSIHHVLAAERILREKGIWIDLVPVPRSLTSECGIAIEFHLKKLLPLQEELASDDQLQYTLYRLVDEGYELIEE